MNMDDPMTVGLIITGAAGAVSAGVALSGAMDGTDVPSGSPELSADAARRERIRAAAARGRESTILGGTQGRTRVKELLGQ